jgi:predicted ATPase
VRAEISNHVHASTIATCNYVAYAFPELAFGDFESCERQNAELVAYCVEKNVQMIRIGGVVCHACARAAREPTAESIAGLRDALAVQRQVGARLQDSLSITLLAEASLTAGDLACAHESLREAFAFVEQSGERFWLSELHRVEGLIALATADASRAQACFWNAIEIARGQRARLLELRAATDLARLWRDANSHREIRALLTPLLATISGGEGLRDVRNARELLAEIVSA